MLTVTDKSQFRRIAKYSQPVALIVGAIAGCILCSFAFLFIGEITMANLATLIVLWMVVISDICSVLVSKFAFIAIGQNTLTVHELSLFRNKRVFIQKGKCKRVYPFANTLLLENGQRVWMNTILAENWAEVPGLSHLLVKECWSVRAKAGNRLSFVVGLFEIIYAASLLAIGLTCSAVILQFFSGYFILSVTMFLAGAIILSLLWKYGWNKKQEYYVARR